MVKYEGVHSNLAMTVDGHFTKVFSYLELQGPARNLNFKLKLKK